MKKELTLLDQYEIQEGETPEIVADKHHGSVYYHWVILMTNGITDPFHDWLNLPDNCNCILQTNILQLN